MLLSENKVSYIRRHITLAHLETSWSDISASSLVRRFEQGFSALKINLIKILADTALT